MRLEQIKFIDKYINPVIEYLKHFCLLVQLQKSYPVSCFIYLFYWQGKLTKIK